jgi:quercetin dioxygenase-like cupin family protein
MSGSTSHSTDAARPSSAEAGRTGTTRVRTDREEHAMPSEPTTTTDGPVDELATKLRRTVLQQEPSSIPGREIVQVLTEIPCGVESGWHTHPGEEVGYIAAGTVEMRIQDRETLTLRTGEGFLIPPRTPHNALDLGPDTGRMLSTYIVEVGRPVTTLVDRQPQ